MLISGIPGSTPSLKICLPYQVLDFPQLSFKTISRIFFQHSLQIDSFGVIHTVYTIIYSFNHKYWKEVVRINPKYPSYHKKCCFSAAQQPESVSFNFAHQAIICLQWQKKAIREKCLSHRSSKHFLFVFIHLIPFQTIAPDPRLPRNALPFHRTARGRWSPRRKGVPMGAFERAPFRRLMNRKARGSAPGRAQIRRKRDSDVCAGRKQTPTPLTNPF